MWKYNKCICLDLQDILLTLNTGIKILQITRKSYFPDFIKRSCTQCYLSIWMPYLSQLYQVMMQCFINQLKKKKKHWISHSHIIKKVTEVHNLLRKNTVSYTSLSVTLAAEGSSGKTFLDDSQNHIIESQNGLGWKGL